MKPEIADRKETKIRVDRNSLLSLVASRLSGRNLFPAKVNSAKEYVRKLKQAH